MSILNESITCLKGIGEKLSIKLAKLKIYRIQDILFHFPLRYEDRTRVHTIADVRIDTFVVVQGHIQKVYVNFKPRRTLNIVLDDGTASILLKFFYFSSQQQNKMTIGKRMICFGEAKKGHHMLQMVHPEYCFLQEKELYNLEQRLTPIYPTTQGLSQKVLRDLNRQAFNKIRQTNEVLELLPQYVLQQYQYPNIVQSLENLHYPEPDASISVLNQIDFKAKERFAFEELLAFQLSLQRQKAYIQQDRSYPCHSNGQFSQALRQALPFYLTHAQERVIQEVWQDMKLNKPMMRLVQGDVGSGKTMIALFAAALALEQGYQVALMAPTEILAEQHYHQFRQWLMPLGIGVAWLTGHMKAKEKRQSLMGIKDDTLKMIIGTHALFQQTVEFHQLALVIIDEQHRFGVHQRLSLQTKGIQQAKWPHQLVLTATPIPRSLAMTFYANLDYSVVDELPPDRKPVKTVALPTEKRSLVIERIAHAVAQGRQVYWVCTLIEDSETLACQAAEAVLTELQQQLAFARIGLIHGRLSFDEKEAVMLQFKKGGLDILVATTVIEVGVDVPNASLMIIENPERLGLSQLHQLRGRVGRGSLESHCVLLYQSPLSSRAKERIETLRLSQDGFYIAEKDLEIRGPGEFLGTKQSGDIQLKIANLQEHRGLIPQLQILASKLLQDDPQQAEKIIERWLPLAKEYGKTY